jgi:Uma2 family endonuclease
VSTTLTKPTTADELFAMPDDGFRYELVKGELIRMAPAGAEHGKVTVRITSPLFVHVDENRLGTVYAAETGFILEQDPDTVRAPDVAFVSRERLASAGATKSYAIGAPDLAVEVVSPGDTVREVEEKVRQWLVAGTRLVWVASPKMHTITVYQSLADIVVLTEKDILDGGDVVPGFSLAVAKIFSEE